MSAKSKIEVGKEILADSVITASIKAKNTYVIIEKTIEMLSGKLSSLKETNQAVEIATKTDGVKKVIAKI